MSYIELSYDEEADYRQLCEERAYWSCLNDLASFVSCFGEAAVMADLKMVMSLNEQKAVEGAEGNN